MNFCDPRCLDAHLVLVTHKSIFSPWCFRLVNGNPLPGRSDSSWFHYKSCQDSGLSASPASCLSGSFRAHQSLFPEDNGTFPEFPPSEVLLLCSSHHWPFHCKLFIKLSKTRTFLVCLSPCLLCVTPLKYRGTHSGELNPHMAREGGGQSPPLLGTWVLGELRDVADSAGGLGWKELRGLFSSLYPIIPQ